MNLKDLIKNNVVTFDSYRQGFFYYKIHYITGSRGPVTFSESYQFPVPLDDIGTATLLKQDKAITFMRWIRKAKEDNTLIKL